jgi:hypothetical protein
MIRGSRTIGTSLTSFTTAYTVAPRALVFMVKSASAAMAPMIASALCVLGVWHGRRSEMGKLCICAFDAS